MTRFDELDQALAAWFDGEAIAPAPDGLLERINAGTAGRRPRARVLATLHDAGLPGIGLRPAHGGSIGRQRTILVLGLLLLALVAAAAVVGSRLLTPSDPILGVFERVDPMPVDARRGVVLPDGRVLVVGPDVTLGGGLTFVLEFDPATGSFAPIGQRLGSLESVTALKDGRLLIVGIPQGPSGRADGPATTGAIFDPITGMSTELGETVEVPRLRHRAVLLPDGRVLLVGGEPRLRGSTASAELFDPATGLFTATGFMAQPRNSGVTATLLGDGRVLVAGGARQPSDDIPELYDPATGTFTATGRMSQPRSGSTATLLPDGRVLFAGGGTQDASGNSFLPAFGEIYDPRTGTFSSTEPMLSPRLGHIAALLRDGRVLIAGGSETPIGPSTRAAEIFDPATGRFEPTSSLTTARSGTRAVVLHNGDVLIFGNESGGEPDPDARSAEVFR